MPFDFDAAVSAPFRMQPGLRRLAPGTRQLTPTRPGERVLQEKLVVLSRFAPQALLAAPGFNARPALDTLCVQAACEWPEAWRSDERVASALLLHWAVEHDRPLALTDSAPPAIGACLAALPAGWRRAGLLALAFAEDLAIVDAASGTIAWLAVCLPSHWAPESKVGRSFAEVHAPVADNALLLRAADQLLRLVSGSERWERFVWTISSHARLHAHPLRAARMGWPVTSSADELAALAWWRTEHQSFIPLPERQQALFLIRVESQPLALAITTPQRAALVHAALSTMSAEVLAYRGLSDARDPLLAWLAARA